MVDETAFRHVKDEINRLPCAFEKALLARHAVCELAAQHHVAERETVECVHPVARAVCVQMIGLLREKSAFALRLPDTHRALSHTMLMKVQCGGLDGLKTLLDPRALAPNVRRLMRLAQERYGDLAALPFSEIVQGVAASRPRRRSGEDR